MLRKLFKNRPELKSPRELGLMREAGKVVAAALRLVRDMAKPGVKTIDIDQAVEDLYRRHGAIPLFKGYRVQAIKVPFPACTCISINEQVVHGIPGRAGPQEGDLSRSTRPASSTAGVPTPPRRFRSARSARSCSG